ncbi:MAG: branched-chain amino acid ABC transporter substrate-binding protein, partial [Methylocystis sp.]|nr:branched-chain amino acid ABC transporter substrate-binding protein [Methylocystis sp.]
MKKSPFLIGVIAAALASAPAIAEPLLVKVGVLRQIHSTETLSILDLPAPDETLAGALLGAADNNTTGKFTNQSFEAIDARVAATDDPAAAAAKLAE